MTTAGPRAAEPQPETGVAPDPDVECDPDVESDSRHEPAPAPLSVHHSSYDPLTHVAQDDRPTAEAEARAAAARAIRDAGHALVGHEAPTDLIERLAATLEDFVTELETGAPRGRVEARPAADWDAPAPADGAALDSFDERPVSGRASPWGLDLDARREGDEVVARLTLRPAHEGAPGRSHGGIVAALFDDVFGFVLTILRQPGFTGELGIRYVAGTPVGRPLECRVRLDRREGRKLYMTGELLDATDRSVVATATATFITIDLSQFRAGA